MVSSITTSLQFWMSGVFNNHKFTILNEWSQQWSHHPDYLTSGVNQNLKFYNFDWLRLLFTSKSPFIRECCLQYLKFTILNKWIQQWFLYQHSRQNGFTNNLKSIILTELEDYRQKYLRLCVSSVFNDHKFTILNEWSQQWLLYQHSQHTGFTNNLKSKIMNE